ncbi:MAG: hypothetical protein QG637_1839, partial [Chloroflexota bacterium]|nr:hypothetical protein [Chloroflexota bacterium]
MSKRVKLDRRGFLFASAASVVGVTLAACGVPQAAPAPAPAAPKAQATTAPAAAAATPTTVATTAPATAVPTMTA